MTTARFRAALRRLALIAFGAVLAVVVLEVALQLGALVVWASGRPAPIAGIGDRRVLCVGDSNTYGLYLADRADAYPSQLARLWNAAPERRPIEVLNLGYPGTNSSRLVRDLPAVLDTLRPDAVIIMVGANDFWTTPVAPPGQPGVTATALLRHSRVYQLVHMLRRAFDNRQLVVTYPARVDGGSAGTARFGDVEFPLGFQRGTRRGAEAYAELEINLCRLADIVRSRSAEPWFLTYASGLWNYGEASQRLRNAAATCDVPLIDAAVPVAALCPAEPCPDWLYPDHHPTAGGYRVMAETVVRALERQP